MQIFRSSANSLYRIVLCVLLAAPLVAIGLALILVRSDYVTGQDRIVTQPVPFSHAHHTAEVGIDCRYCHTGVETSSRAGIPPTSTCMTCHSQLWTSAAMLAPVRNSFVNARRLIWNRVNELPDYVYFDHSIHLAKGVACTTCHGEVGQMKLTRQAAPLTMGWCLDCHRDPGQRLSSRATLFSPFKPEDRDPGAEQVASRFHVSTKGLTDCSVCHR